MEQDKARDKTDADGRAAGALDTGKPRFEPGQPTRNLDTPLDTEELHGEGADELEEIARQQGSTQRGFTSEGPDPGGPARFDPAHPGGKPSGDPRR